MRRFLVIAAAGFLIAPGAASATTETASAGGVSATLSFRNGPGIETKNERLSITAPGMAAYDEPVPSKGCFKVCSPASPKHAVHVLDLYGDGEYAVVLDLFTGGASCCGLEDVYVPSASIGTWVVTTHNFGQDGARIETLSGRIVFVSGDNAFSCEFNYCAADGLPLQIFDFTGDAFHNVTRSYPEQIAKDAAFWWKSYVKYPKNATGLLPPWAADEYDLGRSAYANRRLEAQVAKHRISAGFVKRLEAFLKRHGY